MIIETISTPRWCERIGNTLGLPKNWIYPLAGILLVSLAVIGFFLETWASMVDIWIRSDTYTHGFLVLPISLWLVWNYRDHYRNLQPAISLPALPGVFCCGMLWLVADLAHVLVVQQWAVVGMLVCSLWTILGNHVTHKLLFPILFLFLMVPFGEDFVPPLMEFTATFVVTMLRLTGISVYREGLHFSLTSGNWSVVDACSGIRYLIASITLGLVYMYLNYTSYKKRLLFMLVATLLPILANGLRGYMIVMIGHLSDMKLATGVDHLVYGWLFFGLVMLLMFYVGSFWQDPPYVSTEAASVQPVAAATPAYPHFWGIISTLLCCLLIWPLSSLWLESRHSAFDEIPAQFVQIPEGGWQTGKDPGWDWQPVFKGVASESIRFYSDGSDVAALYVANFGAETEGELINSQNTLLKSKTSGWRVLKTGHASVAVGGGQMDFDTTVLGSNRQELLVYRWYRMGSRNISSTYLAKLWQVIKGLTGDNSAELQMVIYTRIDQLDPEPAARRLQKLAVDCCAG